jgi:hypothetical protein
VYYKLYGTMMPDNVVFRGTGADRTMGNATVKGGVKMPPGLALWDQKDNPSKDLLDHVGYIKWGFTHGNWPENEIKFQNFEMDGNRRNNAEPFTNPNDYGGAGNVENKLRNAGRWAGWQSPREGDSSVDFRSNNQHNYIKNLKFTLDNVAIHGVGGNHVNNSSSSLDINWNNLYVERSQRNHHIYGFAGTANDVLVEGQAWAVHLKLGSIRDRDTDGNSKDGHPRNGTTAQWSSTYRNITVQNLKDNNFGWGNVSELVRPHVDIENITVDLRGADFAGFVFNGRWYGNKINDVTFYTSTNPATLFQYGGNGPYSLQPYERTELTNVTIHAQARAALFSTTDHRQSTNILYDNVTLLDESGGSLTQNAVLYGGVGPSPNVRPPGADRVELRNIDSEVPSNSLAEIEPEFDLESVEPTDVFVDQSTFNNTSGEWSLWLRNADETTKLGRADRVYMSNSTFHIPLNGTTYKDQFHYALSPNPTSARSTPGGEMIVEGGPTLRLRNCDTPNGRVSDSVGNTFTSSTSDEGNDFALIPTSLLGRPFEINTTLTSSPSGISSITSVEVANSDGSLRPDSDPLEHDPYLKVNLDGTIGTGETVTIDWGARVTPLSQYSTTGLFISRPVIDRTSGDDPSAPAGGEKDPLTSGKGPWQIDLRGVAATHETW